MGVCEVRNEDVPAATVSGDVSLDYALGVIERLARSDEWRNAAAQVRERLEDE